MRGQYCGVVLGACFVYDLVNGEEADVLGQEIGVDEDAVGRDQAGVGLEEEVRGHLGDFADGLLGFLLCFGDFAADCLVLLEAGIALAWRTRLASQYYFPCYVLHSAKIAEEVEFECSYR